MPLTMLTPGDTKKITRIGGKEETKHFLESLGFTIGSCIMVVSKNNGNLIIRIKDSRVALDISLASKIMIA